MRLLRNLIQRYPWHTAVMLFALLLASLAEGASLSALLPLLSLAINQETNPDESAAATTDGSRNEFERMVLETFSDLGINPSIGVLLTIIVVGVTLKSLLVLFARKRVGYTAALVTTDLRLSLLRAMLSTRWAYFLHQPVGRLANSMATEAIRASNAYVAGINMITIVLQSGVYFTVAVLVSWEATLACMTAGLFILLASHFLVKMSRKAGKRQTKLLISLLARLTDTLQSVKPLKAMGRENLADAVLSTETTKLNAALQREVFSKAVLNAVHEPMFATVIAVGIFAALVQWQMELATVLVLVLVLTRVLTYLGKIQKQYQEVVVGESAFWSLQSAIQEAEQAQEVISGGETPVFRSAIRMEHVTFSYGEKIIFAELDMEIPVGSLTTIVGPSGAGKTTIVDLITGLQTPTSGQISIDGTPLQDLDLRKWRRMVGYVPQENVLLHDSVLNNVTLGDPELVEADAVEALQAASAWEFVQSMPMGIHNTVGERGTRLSGGQRQRIMIARALAHHPRLLILDEATSALDPKSEALICDSLASLKGRLTILAISHQPALVEAADQIFRLHVGEGAAGEIGGPDPLPAVNNPG